MNKKIGLICEGGGTKAAYTSGVLKALLEHNIYIPYTVGISAGAENLLPYVARQPQRLEVTGIEAATLKGAIGLRPLFKEGGLFGIEKVSNFIESKAPLDFKTFYESSTALDIGIYNIKSGKIEYYDKSYVTKDKTLVKASCALLLLTKPYIFKNELYMDAGLIDMISIERSIAVGNEKHVFISTKEANYIRKPAPKWQIFLAKIRYRKYPHVARDLKIRHINYEKQWNIIHELEKQGKALVLRPSEDQGITRYTQDRDKLKKWFELGYSDTVNRLQSIQDFIV